MAAPVVLGLICIPHLPLSHVLTPYDFMTCIVLEALKTEDSILKG